MGQKGDRTRDSLIAAMIELLQSRGYAGAALNDITALASAPRGSVYFHFPDGKEQLAIAAIEAAAALVENQIDQACARARSPLQVVTHAARTFGAMLQQSDFAKGCPLTAVAATLTGDSPGLQRACAAGFERWIAILAAHLKRTGIAPRRAAKIAEAALASTEGALVMARACRSLAPLESVIAAQASILEGEKV